MQRRFVQADTPSFDSVCGLRITDDCREGGAAYSPAGG